MLLATTILAQLLPRWAGAARHLAWISSGMLAFFDEHLTVYHGHLDSLGQLFAAPRAARQVMRFARFQRSNGRGIEYHQVGRHALPHQTAVIQTEERGG